MNNVEKEFENLLKVADSIAANEDDQLTDEQVEELSKIMESQTDPAQNFPSNNGVEINENTDPENNVMEDVLVSVTPTGVFNTIPYESKNITEESLDELLNLKNEDFGKVELDWEGFKENVNDMYSDVDEEGLKQLFEATNRYRHGEKFPYFNSLPKFVKDEINQYANMGGVEKMASNNTLQQMKNGLAKELFDTIIANNYSTKAFKDISQFTTSEINKEKEKLDVSITNYNNKMRKEYEEGFIKKAEEVENSEGFDTDEEKQKLASNLRKTSRMFTQSYTYEDMYNAFLNRKIKIKSIMFFVRLSIGYYHVNQSLVLVLLKHVS